ncbi:MAG: Rieske 2Fe-2S domain-containing protein [Gammaproteobacteria bacterium]|nr:Rieske 2Fe-2S domain-containing protein [Gammaproteobacteria bacterium]
MPDHSKIAPFPGSAIPHVGTYRRVLPVSLERMYENTLDWEHLPHVHASSFADIRCEDAGTWGWRARTTDHRGHEALIELRLDKACRRWITRTLEGRGQGAEIWTHVFPIAEQRVDIVVDFFVPDVPDGAREKVGLVYADLYETLYDEDVAMMVERQRQLDTRIGGGNVGKREPGCISLGPRADLELPCTAQLGGREYVLAEVAGQLVVYPAVCPHQSGPLVTAELNDGIVVCPWHGYGFDVRTGDCVTGQSCRLGNLPQLLETDGELTLVRP